MAYRLIIQNGGDALLCWFQNKDLSTLYWAQYLNPGTDMIKLITFPFVKYLHLPFWSGFMIFSLIGFTGILIFRSWVLAIVGSSGLALFLFHCILLLPGMHFWTSMPGKEPVIFLCLAILVRAVTCQRISPLPVVAFIALLLIRPHFAVIFSIALVATILLRKEVTLRLRIIAITSLFIIIGLAYSLLMKMQDFSGGFFTAIQRKMEVHIQHMKTTDAYVPLDEYSLPLKLFTFWFLPLRG